MRGGGGAPGGGGSKSIAMSSTVLNPRPQTIIASAKGKGLHASTGYTLGQSSALAPRRMSQLLCSLVLSRENQWKSTWKEHGQEAGITVGLRLTAC